MTRRGDPMKSATAPGGLEEQRAGRDVRARAFVAYLAILAVDSWLVSAGRLGRNDTDVIGVAVTYAFPLLGILVVAAAPGAVAGLDLAVRYAQTRVAGAAINGLAWLAWGILVVIVGTGGTFNLVSGVAAVFYVAAATSGSLFGAAAFDVSSPIQPGRRLAAAAWTIVALIGIGAWLARGWWIGPA